MSLHDEWTRWSNDNPGRAILLLVSVWTLVCLAAAGVYLMCVI